MKSKEEIQERIKYLNEIIDFTNSNSSFSEEYKHESVKKLVMEIITLEWVLEKE